MTETEKLMREYFKNKDSLKQLKQERMIYGSKNKCESQRYGGDICYQEEDLELEDFCAPCKGRQDLYLKTKKLSKRNGGILIRVRNLTKERTKK